MWTTLSYAAFSKDDPKLSLFRIERCDLRPNDIRIEILYSGVCHSDMHAAHGEWDGTIFPDGTIYPCVPGHEVVGRAIAVGSAISKIKVGDLVGVGTMVDSCLSCDSCKESCEQYCHHGPTWTYNSPDRITGENTLGGYADFIVVREEFVLKVRHAERDLAAVAPLLCTGVTMWSPLQHWQAGLGRKVGIVGIGGLGHMGIKLAHSLGAQVVAFTTSASKREDARKLGADHVVVSRSAEEMAAHAGSFDLIINTVAAPGGIAETQDMLDFCAEKGVVADIETIPIQAIDTAFERMKRGLSAYRRHLAAKVRVFHRRARSAVHRARNQKAPRCEASIDLPLGPRPTDRPARLPLAGRKAAPAQPDRSACPANADLTARPERIMVSWTGAPRASGSFSGP